jgi:hypothetical protein
VTPSSVVLLIGVMFILVGTGLRAFSDTTVMNKLTTIVGLLCIIAVLLMSIAITMLNRGY